MGNTNTDVSDPAPDSEIVADSGEQQTEEQVDYKARAAELEESNKNLELRIKGYTRAINNLNRQQGFVPAAPSPQQAPPSAAVPQQTAAPPETEYSNVPDFDLDTPEGRRALNDYIAKQAATQAAQIAKTTVEERFQQERTSQILADTQQQWNQDYVDAYGKYGEDAMENEVIQAKINEKIQNNPNMRLKTAVDTVFAELNAGHRAEEAVRKVEKEKERKAENQQKADIAADAVSGAPEGDPNKPLTSVQKIYREMDNY